VGIQKRFIAFLIIIAALAACSSPKELEDPPIITSASYQHALYNGRPQPIEASAAKDDVPPFIITYFPSEEALLKNEGGSVEAPGEVGDYYVRIERPAGNGYGRGPNIKVEYHIQRALVTISAEDRQEFVYDGKPKPANASTDAPVELEIAYYAHNGTGQPLNAPPVNRGQYLALVSFAGNERYMAASKAINLIINHLPWRRGVHRAKRKGSDPLFGGDLRSARWAQQITDNS
jgi:hypothetical protein